MTLDEDWIELTNPPRGVDRLRVRARRDDGRWVVTDVHLQGQELPAESMRRGLSLPRIEAQLNRPTGEATERERLSRPDRTNPDRFYALVAAAYGDYAALSRAPSRAIADEAAVPVTTAHRWVREARRRGLMPPGRKGRAG